MILIADGLPASVGTDYILDLPFTGNTDNIGAGGAAVTNTVNATFVTDSERGSCIEVNDGYLDTDADIPATYTYMVWVKFMADRPQILLSNNNLIIARTASYEGNPRTVEHIHNLGTYRQLGPQLTENTWHHIACTHDDATSIGRVVVDGVDYGTYDFTGSSFVGITNLSLGYLQQFNIRNYSRWQNLKLTDSVMSLGQIQAIYNAESPASAPTWTAAEIIDEDTVRMTASAPLFFQPSKFADASSRPNAYADGAYGFTLSLANQATDEVVEVRAIDWNSGFGTATIDLTLNRKLWPDDTLTINYVNTGHDFQDSNGMVENITGLVATNSISATIAGYRYVDPAGNDSADGLTPGTAWSTWTKAETEISSLPTNTAVLFKRGETWTSVDIDIDTSDVWLGAYGTGVQPIFDNSAFDSGASAITVGNSTATSNVRIGGIRYEGVENPATNSNGGRFVSFSGGNCTNCYVSHSYVNKGWNSILTLRGGTGIEYVGVQAYNAKNSNLWIGGSKSATELATNCTIRDCISIKNAAYSEEDCFNFHAQSDGSGNTPMNTAFVGTGNKIARCYGEVSGGAGAEQPMDNTYGNGNLIEDCYFYNANTSGTGIAIGWSGNNVTVRGCYIEAALGISSWRDCTIENTIVNAGCFMMLRARVRTDGNSQSFNTNPAYVIRDCSTYCDNRHSSSSRQNVICWVFDTGATHASLNVSGLVIESTGITSQFFDYANDGPDLDITAVSSKNTWDRVKIRANDGADTNFAQDTNGFYTFSEWVTAEGATNSSLEFNTGGSIATPLFVNAGGSYNQASDFLPNTGGAADGTGGNGTLDDFYYGKARNTASGAVDTGALQTGIDYTVA